VTDPILARITVYPIKSLDGVTVKSCACLENGALAFDRRFAIQAADGRFLNAKRTAEIHRLRAEFDLETKTVRLGDRTRDLTSKFPLAIECEPLDRFLSDFFGQTVTLVENDQRGFPDDTEAGGPTVVSEATLQTVAGWFKTLTVHEARRRFRANLEVTGVEPFWEDRLYTSDGGIAFQIGDVRFVGVKPCQRCVVPTRSADTGEITAGFVDDFCRHRELTLPDGVAANRFDHYYRLAVNTIGATGANGQVLTTGDSIAVR
jgi:uncharacterized protein YcbX